MPLIYFVNCREQDQCPGQENRAVCRQSNQETSRGHQHLTREKGWGAGAHGKSTRPWVWHNSAVKALLNGKCVCLFLQYTDLEESSEWMVSSLEDRQEPSKPAPSSGLLRKSLDSPSTSVWGTSTGKGPKSGQCLWEDTLKCTEPDCTVNLSCL